MPASTCSCGRTFDIYDGGIRGRVDDMKVVRGTNVYPRAIEEIVRRRDEIDEFQIHLYTAEAISATRSRCSSSAADGDARAIRSCTELERELAEAHEGLRFGVRLAERGSLPRFELKAKRLVDERDRVGRQGRAEGDVTWPSDLRARPRASGELLDVLRVDSSRS